MVRGLETWGWQRIVYLFVDEGERVRFMVDKIHAERPTIMIAEKPSFSCEPARHTTTCCVAKRKERFEQ